MIKEIDETNPTLSIEARLFTLEDKFNLFTLSVEKSHQEGKPQEQLFPLFELFEEKACDFINALQVKKVKEPLSSEFYDKYLQLILLVESRRQAWRAFEDKLQFQQAKITKGLDPDLGYVVTELRMVIRFLLCNASRTIGLSEEETIIRSIAQLYEGIFTNPLDISRWQLLNDLLGFSTIKARTPLAARLPSPFPHPSRYNPLIMDEFVSFNFLASLYTSIRSNFVILLRKAFTVLLEGGKEQIWDHLERLLFIPANISGGCLFNGKLLDKTKEDMAFGIYLEQYFRLTEILTDSKENSKGNAKIIIELEKRKILSRLFEATKLKSLKIVQRARNHPPEHRFRARQQSVQEVIQSLIDMGIQRQYAEIAIENIEAPDQNLAMEWIDNNRAQVEEQLMLRVIEKSTGRTHSRQEERSGDGIVQVSFDKFKKEVTGHSLRSWIKFAYKELFQSNEESIWMKDILFLCMDYLDDVNRNKQYINFNEKIYKDLDDLNKEANITPKLKLLVSIMETLVDKLPKARSLFYQKAVHMKVISYLERVEQEEKKNIFSLLNSYLPIITPEILTAQLEEYLAYLLDLINRFKPTTQSIYQIFYKIANSKKKMLIERIKRNVVDYLMGGLVWGSIFPLLIKIFESDQQLCLTTAQLDLKTFLYERYKHRINSFHPDKEHVLQIDIKEFVASFSKYDKDSAIYVVSKRLLTKKKNKNKYFYYDCRKKENDFAYSTFSDINFISYTVKNYQKTIIRALITTLFRSASEQIEQKLTQLHKVLEYFKIFVPFVLKQVVDGTCLVEWLLECPSQSKKKYGLLKFLTLNNFYIKKNQELYNFSSIGDYACARAVNYLLNKAYQNNEYHSILSAYYLQQVRKFSQFCSTPYNQENPNTILSQFEELIQTASPLQYLAINEFLYVQYKRVLLNNLKRKYKIVGSQSEPIFDRQFLNLSPFYNTLPIKETQIRKPVAQVPVPVPVDVPREGMLPMQEVSDSEEENAENVGRPALLYDGTYFQGLIGRRPQQQELVYEQLIAPLPIKAPKEGEEQPVLQPIVCANNFTVVEILQLFQGYFAFEIDVHEDNVDIPEAPLAVRPVKINENLAFKVNMQDGVIDIELRVRKNAAFERHFVSIVQIFEPKVAWEDKKMQSHFERRVQEISRRMFAGQNREEMMHHLERLMIGRDNREDEPAQAPPRLLNATQIYNNVQEFTQAIVPVIQKDVLIQEPKLESEAPKEQRNQAELEVPIEPVVNSDVIQPNLLIEQPQNIVIPDNSHNAEMQIVEIPEVAVQIEEPIVEPAVLHIAQPIVEPLEPAQQPVQQQAQQQQIQADVPLVEVPPVVPQPPVRDREILRVFGLPQTFLRDAGIDEQSFDSLPEDFQQQQLMHFISQQNQALNRPNPPQNQNNPQNPNNPNNVPPATDLTSDNMAFLASLDMQTRAQVLVEATPDFLSTLPANIRQEAENYRHQQINRIIQEEEIEEERKLAAQKPKAIVYPKIYREEFSAINESASKKLFEGIFYFLPNLKLQGLKILLENKQCRDKTLASIIGILRYLEKNQNKKIFSLKKVKTSMDINQQFEWSNQDTQNIRVSLLHTLYENLRIPFVHDNDFLTQSTPTETYFDQLNSMFEGEELIDPQMQLFEFALKYYAPLASQLIKIIKALPQRILVKIVEAIKADSLPMDFYDHMANFSDDQVLKKHFSICFQHEKPKIEVMGKLLKYNFSHIPTLRKMHQEALQKFSNSYYEFLNEIFRIYTLETLHEIEPVLAKHKQIHFQVIRNLLQQNREIEKQPIGLLLKRPQLLDFESKKFIFRNHPRIRKLARHRVHIEVDRTHLFQGSYNQLMSRTLRQLEGRIQVSFVNEAGYDAGGLKREWFLLVSREIFNQDYALFEKSSSGSTYQPNPKSYINPDHLNYFKFIGRFIGKALVQRELIDAYFTRAFYKMILGQELEFKDLEAEDYEFYKSMEWLKNNPIDENMFTFSYIYDNFGKRVEKELMPGGKDIIVNEQNKLEYIEKYCLSKMRDDFSAQIGKFLQGFHQIVPRECVSFFEAKELELLISGVPEVDVEDFKKNVDYNGFAPGDQIIGWFWEIVQEYSQEDLAKLVQFITGTSKIPVEGFSQLVGMNGIQRISIHRDPCEHQLPKSHTCFNQLDLPNYPSKEILQQKLAICLAWGSEGFGFM